MHPSILQDLLGLPQLLEVQLAAVLALVACSVAILREFVQLVSSVASAPEHFDTSTATMSLTLFVVAPAEQKKRQRHSVVVHEVLLPLWHMDHTLSLQIGHVVVQLLFFFVA